MSAEIAPASAPPLVDDLTLSLAAICGDATIVATNATAPGGLMRATDTTNTPSSACIASPEASLALAAAGCKRLIELVHGNPAHKAEAVSRGALGSLASACTKHEDAQVRTLAARAVRSICFKNDDARRRVATTKVLEALLLAATASLNQLEAVAVGGSADAFDLACVEEVFSTLAALVNRHEVNTAMSVELGAAVLAERACNVVPKVTDVAVRAGAGGVSTSMSPAEVVKKARFFAMMVA